MWDENPCGMLIRQLHLSLARRSDHELREHNLTLAQLTALLLLTETPEGELSLKELERLLQVSQPDAAGLAVRLEKKGMIEGFTDPADKRMKRVRLTSFGEQYCRESRGRMAAFEASLLSGMTAEEKATFQRLLRKANQNMESLCFKMSGNGF